jgi:hypothetical protein
MEKIDRLGWAEAACMESYGVKIGIRATGKGVLDQVVPYLPPDWRPIAPPRRLAALYSWVVGGKPRPGVKTFDVMYMGAKRISRTLDRQALLRDLQFELWPTIALLSPRFVFIHAGVVSWRGSAILIPGRTRTGKSTLVEAMVRAGAEYLSDEFALLDRNGRVHPFAKPISIRTSGTDTNELLPVESIGGSVAEGPLRVGAIVVTRHRDNAKSNFRIVSSGQGMMSLLFNAVAARMSPTRVMRATREASARAVVLRGPRGEAKEAAARAFAILDGRPIEHRSLGGFNGIAQQSSLGA